MKDPYEGLSDKARETCIRRMAKTLSRKPKNRRERDYVKSLLPHQEGPMKQYRRSQKAVHEAIQRDRAFAAAKAIVERLKKRDPELIVHKARKDRISPFAHKTQLRHQTKFCRRASRYQRHISGGRDREARDMEEMREVRRILFSVQHGICGICGQIMEMEPERCSLDHVIPHCMGGGHGLGNYIACHKECNGDKTNDVPTGCEMVFLLFVNNIIGRDPKVF